MSNSNPKYAIKKVIDDTNTLTASDIMKAYGKSEQVSESINNEFEDCIAPFRDGIYPIDLIYHAAINANTRLCVRGDEFFSPTTIIVVYIDAIVHQINKYDNRKKEELLKRLMYGQGFLKAIAIKDRYVNVDDIIEAYNLSPDKINDSIRDSIDAFVDSIWNLTNDPFDIYDNIINQITTDFYNSIDDIDEEFFCKRVVDSYVEYLKNAIETIKEDLNKKNG